MAKYEPMQQRAKWWDYKSPCIYMITLKKCDTTPRFCNVIDIGTPSKMVAAVKLTETGQCVADQMHAWLSENPEIRLLNMAIMPDHIHMLIRVTEKTERHLSHILKAYKLFCNRALAMGVFESNFNDKIVRRRGQKDNFYRYIADNPRRYLARRLHANYFARVHRFIIKGTEYSLFGNLFLLNAPDKTVVRYSSRHTPQQRIAKQNEYAEAMRTAGVMVSPFIHPEERAVRHSGAEAGCSFIHIVQNGFGERFKPSGTDFDLCAAGRLLLIGPTEQTTRRADLHRDAAMAANALAEAIAALSTATL